MQVTNSHSLPTILVCFVNVSRNAKSCAGSHLRDETKIFMAVERIVVNCLVKGNKKFEYIIINFKSWFSLW